MPGKYALLIGNSTFRHEGLARLSAPQNDVRALAELLEDPALGGFDVDLKLDVTNVDALDAAGRLFRDRHPDDMVLFYYSGHGLRDARGRFYLAMTATDPRKPELQSLDRDLLRREMDDSASQRQLMILDCCHSGAMLPNADTGLTARRAEAPVLNEQTFEPTGHGRFIMAATSAELSAFEQGGQSIFTRHLVDGLSTGAAAPEKDEISVFDLHDYVLRRVKDDVEDLMRPQLWRDAQVNPTADPLVISRNPNPRPSLPVHLETDLWAGDDEKLELSVFRLIEIIERSEEPLASDASRVLSERLAQGETLTYTIGARIAERVRPAEAAHGPAVQAAEARAAEAEARLDDLGSRLSKTRSAIEMLEAERRAERAAAGTQIAQAQAQQAELAAELSKAHAEVEERSRERDAASSAKDEAASALDASRTLFEEQKLELDRVKTRASFPGILWNPFVLGLVVALTAAGTYGGVQWAGATIRGQFGDEIERLDRVNDALRADLKAARDTVSQQALELEDSGLSTDAIREQEAVRFEVERQHLLARIAELEASQPPPSPASDMGLEEAQALLAELGRFDETEEAFASGTLVESVRRFQRDFELRATGRLDMETALMLRAVAKLAADPDGAFRGIVDVANSIIVSPPIAAPGTVRKDCPECPEMVMIEGGTFVMGSPDDEEGRDDDEGPQRQVTVQPFALARTEVTFAQWDACVADGGCGGYRPDDSNWGRGELPVINVSWADAQAYIDWLNAKAGGEVYRLPSEAEWEYAARAGTLTRFAFGDEITEAQANFGGNVGRTVAVGDLEAANAWGLRHMHGNVWEWVEDCWHGDYEGASSDARPWLSEDGGDCTRRVVRGGSWVNGPGVLRSANRSGDVPEGRVDFLGFRPARTPFTP